MRQISLNIGKKQSQERAFFEPLEQRKLMSASYNSFTQALVVTGTAGNDTITVTQAANQFFTMTQVHENGVRTFNSPLLVRSITINAGNGADRVTIGAGVQGCVINGQGGNDNLSGGDGADLIDGGTGDDYLFGGAGDDVLRGGDNNDTCDGWTGNDRIYGGAGNDYLLGWFGNDEIYGEAGQDRLEGEGDNDYLNGGTEFDRMFGGDGNDYLDGSDGTYDVMDGGWGDDTAYIDPYDFWPTTCEHVVWDLVHFSGSQYV